MKKLILATFLFISSFQFATAQENFDDLFKEMEKMQQEMIKQLGQMNLEGSGLQFFMDTTIVQKFGDLDIGFNDELLQQLDPKMFEGLLGQMQEELSKMDEEDWAEIGKLFKNFENIIPMTPQTNTPGDSTDPKDKPAKKGEKKRKIYKM